MVTEKQQACSSAAAHLLNILVQQEYAILESIGFYALGIERKAAAADVSSQPLSFYLAPFSVTPQLTFWVHSSN